MADREFVRHGSESACGMSLNYAKSKVFIKIPKQNLGKKYIQNNPKKRGRVELARIEDKTSRQVRFSKRKGGLFKKAEVALLVLSLAGRFFEFSSSSCIEKTIKRYRQFMCAQEEANNDRKSKVDINEAKNKKSKCPSSDFTFKLLEFAHWFPHENIDQVEFGALEELENVLFDALSMTKSKQVTYLYSCVFCI
ncbi:transcription factor CAULIFLOWER D [Carex littledalei]|uniref:Transcription factor CAULIFLOWER D n=1 Tax=Carex littledalei TaxID=544730 RepID=A0A833VY52_9POAL|nr:transcription factor CAULIFLOWER D [Carex littledalei]